MSLALTLAIPPDPAPETRFPDCRDYLHQAAIPLASLTFFAPQPAPGFYPRAFVVPLCYKLAGGNPQLIIVLQKLMHCVTAFALAAALANLLQSAAAKYLLLAAVYLLSWWWTILGWTLVLLSESLTFSFFFLWLASFLFFQQRGTRLAFALHLAAAAALAFSRDTWPYVLIFFYLLLVGAGVPLKMVKLRPCAILLAASLLFFVVQQWTAAVGQRTRLPLLNNIVMRVLPKEDYTRWMINAGMPQADELAARFEQHRTAESRTLDLYELYGDPTYAPLFEWVNTRGKAAYTRFLLTHWRQTLLLREKRADLARMFPHDLTLYVGKPKGWTRAVRDFFPLVNLSAVALLLSALLAVFWRTRERRLLIPLLFAALCAFQAVLSYHADALEVERHEVLTRPLMDLIAILSVAMLLDVCLRALKENGTGALRGDSGATADTAAAAP